MLEFRKKTARISGRPKAKFKYTFPGARGAYPESLHSCFRCCSTALPGSSVSGYTASSPSVAPVCPLHTFTNDSKCPLLPKVPAPDTPASVHALTCPHTYTHTHTHVFTHTLAPAPPLRLTRARRAGHGLREVGGAGRRGPTRAVSLEAEPRVLSAKSSRPPGFPKTRRPSRLPLRGEASAFLTARSHRSPRIQIGAGEEEGEDPLLDFLRRNSSRQTSLGKFKERQTSGISDQTCGKKACWPQHSDLRYTFEELSVFTSGKGKDYLTGPKICTLGSSIQPTTMTTLTKQVLGAIRQMSVPV
ncbi:uncharacterized protein LOC123596430 [Leopardus geoffroyi]|uniref:uncharacterized protein LOC123596430 n=1 Tax=Leopardus geoffroyi TaxID=46844 RepID=UPI001E25D4D9|nr:uncharacterized protein LOC123596430 [Leopardus geoffroyi]